MKHLIKNLVIGLALVIGIQITSYADIATSGPAVGFFNSGTVTSGSITNSDISGTAAISLSKLASITPTAAALASSANGVISATTTTLTELGYIHGVTGNIQTQLAAVAALANSGAASTATIATRNGTVTPSVGTLGEFNSVFGGAAIDTISDTSIVTLTLTPGVWMVTVWAQSDPGGGQTGFDISVYFKGVFTSTYGLDYASAVYSINSKDTCFLPPQMVIVAAADSDKTILIKSRSNGASGFCSGYITAFRVA